MTGREDLRLHFRLRLLLLFLFLFLFLVPFVVGSLIVGCHDYVPIPMPPLTADVDADSDATATAAASMILLVTDDDGGYASAFGVPLRPVAEMPVFSRPARAHAYALTFSCPLDVIGVQKGPLPLAESPAEEASLPPPIAIYALDLGPHASSHADASAWRQVLGDATEVARIRDLVHRIPVEEDNLCKLYGSGAEPAQPPFAIARGALARPQLMVRGDDDSALLATSDGEFFRISGDSTVTQVPTPTDAGSSTIAFPHGAGYRDTDGSVWLVGTDGAIAHGQLASGLAAFERFDVRTSTTYSTLRVDGARGGAPLEIFLVSATGNLERFDGSDWTLVSAPASPGSGFGRAHDVLWVAPGEALATGLGEYPNQVVHYRAGSEMTIEPLEPGSGRPVSIARLDAHGTFVGTDTGQIAVLGDTGFRTIAVRWPESAVRSRQVHVFASGDEDVLFGMIYFARFHPIAGICPLEFEAAPTDEIVSLPGGIHILRPFPNFLEAERWGLSTLVTRSRRPDCLSARTLAPF
ncbi:MAG: hypothetical protein IPK13_21860 [Deltaproteobacteria bacterium]|nr:hypothetical protein [Deltaproteobacteria bacterium]